MRNLKVEDYVVFGTDNEDMAGWVLYTGSMSIILASSIGADPDCKDEDIKGIWPEISDELRLKYCDYFEYITESSQSHLRPKRIIKAKR